MNGGFPRFDRSACEHPTQLSTVNFGLERIVCLDCGSVTMRRDSDGEPGSLFKVPHPVSREDSS